MIVTPKEMAMLARIAKSEFQDGRTGEALVDNFVWTFSVAGGDDLTASEKGVLSSLQEKGLISIDNNGPKRDHCVALTAEGVRVRVRVIGTEGGN